MKKKFIKTPLVGVQVHGAKDVGTRTVNLLMGEHAGEYVRGDIMDANAVIQAFDELKGNVDNDHNSLEEIVDEIHNLRDATDQSFEVFQEKAEEETANRIQGDKTLDEKIDQKERESKERDNVLQQNIDTEKQERVNADTQLRNDLTAEVNRAKASENALSSDIQAEATKRENDDNTIKDNLNAEVTRATAKENEIKAEVDVINGDSATEGSFRKAIADVVGAAPEAYDTLKEIADKLKDNDDLHTAINDAIATKATTIALNEEITRAKAAEAENKAEIAAETARAKEVEGDNALAIQNEESRATTAETAINEAVSTEVERAKGQEAYLQNLVNTKADTTALDGAKAELNKKISDETTRATAEEDELRSLITTEQNRATTSEKSIADDLNGKLVQKADTTALNNYVLTTVFNAQVNSITDAINAKAETIALTALEQKVTANTAAIDTKQPKGNYLTEHQSLEEYAKKVELPTVPTKTSQLTNDSNFITAADDGTIETNRIRINEFGFTNNKGDTTENYDPLYIHGETGAILVQNNADLSIGYDNRIRTNPFWKLGSYGADFTGGDSKKRIEIRESVDSYANIFGIKLSNNVFNQNSYINDPCEIENNRDYVSFSKKIKVSDIITDATTDSSLNTVLSKKVDTGAFNSFASSVSGQLNSFNGALSAFGGQIALKQDKITPTAELDLTSIDTADIESLRSIVKALATELNTLGLIKLKSAEETA